MKVKLKAVSKLKFSHRILHGTVHVVTEQPVSGSNIAKVSPEDEEQLEESGEEETEEEQPKECSLCPGYINSLAQCRTYSRAVARRAKDPENMGNFKIEMTNFFLICDKKDPDFWTSLPLGKKSSLTNCYNVPGMLRNSLFKLAKTQQSDYGTNSVTFYFNIYSCSVCK